MKDVYLLPGFMESDLGELSTGKVLWWDYDSAYLTQLGMMRLAPNGLDPGPPDGVVIGVDPKPKRAWPGILTALQSQLDQTQWRVAVGTYDWRKSLQRHAELVATSIRTHSTPAEPATIVGNSAGGLIAVLAWASLFGSGNTNLVRRIISICTPFQGAYGTIQFTIGVGSTITQLLTYGQVFANIGLVAARQWTLAYISDVAYTWPTFYELYPALGGSEAARDPNRVVYYNAANYPAPFAPSQAWLDYAKNTFQPLIASDACRPPQYVMTCVYSTGFETQWGSKGAADLLSQGNREADMQGDGIVTAGSAQLPGSLTVGVTGFHMSVPAALAANGKLAELILDPRGPLTPPAPPQIFDHPLPALWEEPPSEDPITGLVCIGGG